jgi:tellurite resistance protein
MQKPAKRRSATSKSTKPRKSQKRRRVSAPARPRTLTADQAIVAILIASMLANDHLSADEGERAHQLIWSMRRFRRKSGETVGRVIEQMRSRVASEGTAAVVQQAVRVLPAGDRSSVLAVAADLVLADGRLQRQERQFLSELARQLKVAPALSLQILKVISVKNAL